VLRNRSLAACAAVLTVLVAGAPTADQPAGATSPAEQAVDPGVARGHSIAGPLPGAVLDPRRWVHEVPARLAVLDEIEAQRGAAAFVAALPALAEHLDRTIPQPPALPQPSSPGGILCPVAGGARFADDFGVARPGRRHEGIDLMGTRGQELLAAESGIVSHTRSRSGGNQVWLHGNSGTRYFYAHLDGYVGGPRRVVAGEVVGRMGNTGTGAVHLHFEIRPGGGRAVNPYEALRSAC
jgi:murein DD-endopeptidase MepM/ murein hydrolase activator NlpD